MIKVSQIRSPEAACAYFEEELTSMPAQWEGRSASRLGIEGNRVTYEGFARAACALSPADDSVALTQRYHENRRVGSDWVISATKSFSVAAFLSPNASLFRQAFDKATSLVSAYLEPVASTVTFKKNHHPAATNNLLAARIHHALSRHGDPHLHTHLVVFNTTYDAGLNQWRHLETRLMMDRVSEVDRLFNSELYAQISEHGIPAKIDSKGRCQLPALDAIAGKFSKAQHSIDGWEISQSPKATDPERGRVLSRQWANDRNRPRKSKNAKEWELSSHLIRWEAELQAPEVATIERATRLRQVQSSPIDPAVIALQHSRSQFRRQKALKPSLVPLPTQFEQAAQAAIDFPGPPLAPRLEAQSKLPRCKARTNLATKRKQVSRDRWLVSRSLQLTIPTAIPNNNGQQRRKRPSRH